MPRLPEKMNLLDCYLAGDDFDQRSRTCSAQQRPMKESNCSGHTLRVESRHLAHANFYNP